MQLADFSSAKELDSAWKTVSVTGLEVGRQAQRQEQQKQEQQQRQRRHMHLQNLAMSMATLLAHL